MKRVVIIGSQDSGEKNDPHVIARQLTAQGFKVSVCYWEQLVFEVTTSDVRVRYIAEDIATDMRPDLVIALNWYKNGAVSFYRDIAFSMALYLEHHNIRFWNTEMKLQRSRTKLSCMVQLALQGVPVPRTLFSVQGVLDLPEPPFIIKAISASRGKNNHLVQSVGEANELLSSSVPFIVQPFLPNDHDLRIVCFGGEPVLALRRSREDEARSHLNNTSQGGTAEWLEMSRLDPELLTLSKKICIILGREMGGIDFIPDSASPVGYSCLEVNAIPQLTSGYDTEKKLIALANTIKETL